MALSFDEIKEIIDRAMKNKAEELNLKYHEMNDEQIEFLAVALINNKSIKVLNLLENCFGLKGISAIAQVFKYNTTVTSLDLGNNNLGLEGAKIIAQVLRQNMTLKSISLRCTKMGSEGMKHIAEALRQNTTLTSIDLSWNNLGPAGAKNLANALRQNVTVRSINLGWCELGPEGTNYIMHALRQNNTLTSINMGLNDLSIEGARYVAETLKHNTMLTTIDLKNNNLGPKGVEYLVDALWSNTTVTSIELGKNNLKHYKAQFLSEINEILERNKAIQLIKQEIANLSPTTCLPASKEVQTLDKKECAEFDIYKEYQSILAKCVQLETQGCDGFIMDTLRAEALLNYCSWDQGEELSVEKMEQGALTTRQRIHVLQELQKTIPVDSLQKKILSQLSVISLHYGMTLEAQGNRKTEAKEYYLFSYTCAMQGIQDETTRRLAIDALRFWEGRGVPPEAHLARELEKATGTRGMFLEQYKCYASQSSGLGFELELGTVHEPGVGAMGIGAAARRPLVCGLEDDIEEETVVAAAPIVESTANVGAASRTRFE